jgi:hypothetical protein
MEQKESVARLIYELPDNYETECEKQGAVTRWRGVKNAADLMLLMLIHLMNGTSLLEMSVITKLLNIGELSDVAFMNRLAKCKDWFNSISNQLLNKVVVGYQKPKWLEPYIVTAVDASDVVEKGRSKRTFRLHYMLDIFNMTCEGFKITAQKIGETLCNYDIKKKMLIIGDRAYSTIKGMSHCINNGADYILRMRKNSFTPIDKNGETIDLYEKFKHLKEGKVAEIQAFATNQTGEVIPVRICAKRKTDEQIQKTWDKMDRVAKSRKYVPSDEVKAFNEFIIVVTSLPKKVTTKQVLETYRLRWQVEICFKRFKSILDFGELPKKTDGSTMAWLSGKMMVALLMECVIANSFSPNSENKKLKSEKFIS